MSIKVGDRVRIKYLESDLRYTEERYAPSDLGWNDAMKALNDSIVLVIEIYTYDGSIRVVDKIGNDRWVFPEDIIPVQEEIEIEEVESSDLKPGDVFMSMLNHKTIYLLNSDTEFSVVACKDKTLFPANSFNISTLPSRFKVKRIKGFNLPSLLLDLFSLENEYED